MTPNEQTIVVMCFPDHFTRKERADALRAAVLGTHYGHGSIANYDPFIYELPCWLKPKRRREPAELAGLDMAGEAEQEL